MIDFDFQQISREIKIWKGKLSEPQIYAKCLRLLPDLSINDFKEIYESPPPPPPRKGGRKNRNSYPFAFGAYGDAFAISQLFSV